MSRQASHSEALEPQPQSLFFNIAGGEMYLCYIDESGTPDIPGNTSHFVLTGLSIPIWHWKQCDSELSQIKHRYQLDQSEIHIAFMLRKYIEQAKIPGFEKMDADTRRYEVQKLRNMEILALQKAHKKDQLKQTKINHKKTQAYIHLTLAERQAIVNSFADKIGSWGFARMFAECVDKIHFNPARAKSSISEQSFEQVVSRFEAYLEITEKACGNPTFGMLIHDNNPTVALKHTELMKQFHQKGTLWTTVNNIIETPLFVDSKLTSMIQAADVCAYALRRYLENGEEELFKRIFPRADRRGEKVEGVRHFTNDKCKCMICNSHRK
jgi:hypothetical protein